jgi:transcriptional regulator with XRE-family HTH domain
MFSVSDRYSEETLRLATLLASLAKTKGRSIRSLEQQMGVGTSIFHKVLKGEVTLQVRHVLMIADAMGIDWDEFFHLAYPRRAQSAEGSVLEDLEVALEDEELPEFEERVKRVLHQLGLIDEEPAPGFRRRQG